MVVVYEATNKVNGDSYVGVTSDFRRRVTQHRFHAARQPKTCFHRALARFGSDAFEIQPIATCLGSDRQTAVDLERVIIEDRRPVYNQTNGGQFTIGKRVPRETVERIVAANTGKKRTPEQNAAMSATKRQQYAERPELRVKIAQSLVKARAARDPYERRETSRKVALAHPFTAEAIAKGHAAAVATNRKRVVCLNDGKEFASARDASKHYGLGKCSVSHVCTGRVSQVHGLRFAFA